MEPILRIREEGVSRKVLLNLSLKINLKTERRSQGNKVLGGLSSSTFVGTGWMRTSFHYKKKVAVMRRRQKSLTKKSIEERF